MTAIFRHPVRAASVLCAALVACGGRASSGGKGAEPAPARVIPLASAIGLETSGPPPSDTTVTFTAGEPRVIVLRHGPPENVVFAEVSFAPQTFHADSGRPVKVEIRPRPGVYGIDLVTSVPFSEGVSVVFRYARYFSASAKARAVYGSDALYERALTIGQLLGTGQTLSLLPTTRPGPDNLQAALPAAGTYLVAAPESP